MFTLPAPLLVRAVSADDDVFLSELYASTRADLAAMTADPAFVAQLIGMQQQMQSQGYRVAFPHADYGIVERDGQAIGRLVTEANQVGLHLVDLAFVPSARAAGNGSAVLRALQAAAAARGLPLTLSVSHANDGAARLYARLGFQTVASDHLQQRLRWSAA